MNDRTSASQWEFPAVTAEDEEAKPPQPSAVCQENAGQQPEASSGLAGRCQFNNQYWKVRIKKVFAYTCYFAI